LLLETWKDHRSTFREHLANWLKGRKGEWINDDCGREYSAGCDISSHGDSKHLALAQAPGAMASCAREAPTPILALGDDVEAALRATLGK